MIPCAKRTEVCDVAHLSFSCPSRGEKQKACLKHLSCIVCNVKNDFYDITCLCQRQNPGFVSFGRIVTVSEMVHFSM